METIEKIKKIVRESHYKFTGF